MIPTMTNSRVSWPRLAACVIVAAACGCSKEYKQSGLGPGSPRWAEVQSALDALRQAGEAGLDGFLAERAKGLDGKRTEALRATLVQFIKADGVKLVGVDRFGDDVYRARFAIEESGRSRMVPILMDEKVGQLRWLGRN